MRDLLESLVAELVAINSVNPSLSDGPGEAEIARRIERKLNRAGLEPRLQWIAPDRANVVCTVPGRSDGPAILLNAHLDTVGTDGMDAPFSLKRDGDCLYGRGTYDMKGSVAVMLVVAERLATNPPAGDVHFTFVADEEDRSLGTEHLLSKWLPTLPRRPDAALVLEPTEELIGIAHKGFVWYELEIRGRAAHGSRPEEGVDAVLPLRYALSELSEISDELARQPPDDNLGHSTIHMATIDGGSTWSVIPELARLRWERRTLPHEQTADVDDELGRVLRAVRSANGEINVEGSRVFERRPFCVLPDSLPARMLSAVNPALRTTGVSFWADSALIGEHMPAVLFGPIGHGAHAVDEWVSLDSLERVANTLLELVRMGRIREEVRGGA